MIPVEYVVVLLLSMLFGCGAILLYHRWRSRQMLARLNAMLDDAIGGTFTEHIFDETVLSALENKMAEYLASAAITTQQLQQEKNTIKELISDISHQTKTPIANILLYAQLLQEQNLPTESQECVAALQGQADKLSFLIASLVKLSRLETGILVVQPFLQPLEGMLQQLEMQYRPAAEAKGIRLIVEHTEEQAVFDAKWTTEAVGNVIDNAVKYTPAGGTVRVSAVAYELFCRIDVADTGLGIAEDEQSKIFSRFYRSPQVAQDDGVGIGLYLTRQILSQQGGYIKVSSKPGAGAVFSVFLQRQQEILQNC